MKNTWKICIVLAIVVAVVASVAVVVYVNRDVKNIIYYSSAELNDFFDLDCQVCMQGLWADLTWRVQYNNRANVGDSIPALHRKTQYVYAITASKELSASRVEIIIPCTQNLYYYLDESAQYKGKEINYRVESENGNKRLYFSIDRYRIKFTYSSIANIEQIESDVACVLAGIWEA
ncbi:MAG: hypothetical protein SO434_00995 [Eubacteriales bacterium]|nr:hypothetical protein [Eubacteriales bacterium]